MSWARAQTAAETLGAAGAQRLPVDFGRSCGSRLVMVRREAPQVRIALVRGASQACVGAGPMTEFVMRGDDGSMCLGRDVVGIKIDGCNVHVTSRICYFADGRVVIYDREPLRLQAPPGNYIRPNPTTLRPQQVDIAIGLKSEGIS